MAIRPRMHLIVTRVTNESNFILTFDFSTETLFSFQLIFIECQSIKNKWLTLYFLKILFPQRYHANISRKHLSIFCMHFRSKHISEKASQFYISVWRRYIFATPPKYYFLINSIDECISTNV